MILAAFLIILGLLFCVCAPRKYDLRVNSISHVTIDATKDVIDKVTTEQLQNAAAEQVAPSFHYEPGVKEEVLSSLADAFQELRSIQQYGLTLRTNDNGQLIDAASEYYRNGEGQRVSIKRMDGTEHREFYNFSNTGTFLRNFGNKTFVVACPACREWCDILKKHVDLAFELGADGVFFDQLGLASYPCCDPAHGHGVPFTGLMQAKRELCRQLYLYAKSKGAWL